MSAPLPLPLRFNEDSSAPPGGSVTTINLWGVEMKQLQQRVIFRISVNFFLSYLIPQVLLFFFTEVSLHFIYRPPQEV